MGSMSSMPLGGALAHVHCRDGPLGVRSRQDMLRLQLPVCARSMTALRIPSVLEEAFHRLQVLRRPLQ